MDEEVRRQRPSAQRVAMGKDSGASRRFRDDTDRNAAPRDGQGTSQHGVGPRNPSPSHSFSLVGVLARGLLAGAAGVAAMTVAEKLEQAFTGRSNSYVPAHTLERLLGMAERPDEERLGMNWAMHWGQGCILGIVRAAMADRGIRGPIASFLHLNLRLLNDQMLENATGVGAPPWTWPADEQVIDLMHKAIYAYATGTVADWLVNSPADQEPVKGGHYYDQQARS